MVAVTLGCVVLAALGLKASELSQDFQVIRTTLGRPARINEGTVTVDHLQVAKALVENGQQKFQTRGLFVMVSVSVAATGRGPLVISESRLISGSRTYLPFSTSALVQAAPGFRSTADFVYEVDPQRISGLTLELWRTEILSAYPQRVRVDLGVTAQNSVTPAARAGPSLVEPDSYGTTRVI